MLQQSSFDSEIREEQKERIDRMGKEMNSMRESVQEISSLLKRSTPRSTLDETYDDSNRISGSTVSHFGRQIIVIIHV